MSKKFTFALMALAMSALTSTAAINDEPIFDVDDIPGETKMYTMTVTALSLGTEIPSTYEHSEVHFGDNGMVYFFNFTGENNDTYIMGAKKSDSEITIPLPQLESININGSQETQMILDLVKEVDVPEEIKTLFPGMWEYLFPTWYGVAYDMETSVSVMIDEDQSMHLECPEGLMIGLVETPPSNPYTCPVAVPITSITFTPEFEVPDVPTGVDMIDNGVESVVYYDLQGRVVENPAEGNIYISVTTKADGSKVSQKIVK